MSEPVSNYRLEKLVLGELGAEESAALLRDPEVARRAEALRADNERILARHPLRLPETDFAAARRRSPFGLRSALSGFRSALSFRLGPVPVAAFAAFAVVFGSVLFVRGGVDDGTRLKGQPASLFLYRKTASEAVELRDGAAARRGDTIQAAYAASERLYGFIFSLDGNGRLTPHYPEAGNAATELERGELRVLDSAYILDDAPRYELFLLVASRRPFDLEKVERAALEIPVDSRFAAALGKRLGSAFTVASVNLIKE